MTTQGLKQSRDPQEAATKNHQIRKTVRENYGKIARQGTSCCPPQSCGCDGADPAYTTSLKVGYEENELQSIPEGANLGLGCGNPVALASLREGETVLDLGSGGGLDCFLAAQKVGSAGRVIGVDMTLEMLEKARSNAQKGGFTNVEFRQGEIESLPVADSTVDAIISNCVINLSPDKPAVFQEAFRVLKPGGRLMISDLVLTRPMPSFLKSWIDRYIGCVAHAIPKQRYLGMIQAAGFTGIRIVHEAPYVVDEGLMKVIKQLAGWVLSVKVHAVKPAAG